jgi:phosphoglycerate dehydrogenase-like enzyme
LPKKNIIKTNKEPLPQENRLRLFPQNIFGTHNGSNTLEAVDKVSKAVLIHLSKI